MKLETKDILEFINNNQDFEVKFDYLELDWGIDYNLYSRKLNVTVTIMAPCSNDVFRYGRRKRIFFKRI